MPIIRFFPELGTRKYFASRQRQRDNVHKLSRQAITRHILASRSRDNVFRDNETATTILSDNMHAATIPAPPPTLWGGGGCYYHHPPPPATNERGGKWVRGLEDPLPYPLSTPPPPQTNTGRGVDRQRRFVRSEYIFGTWPSLATIRRRAGNG